jgi:5'-3' exonuclease
MRGAEDTLITEENIVELTGLTPTAWLYYQALKGDTTDSVPGLPGIGDKMAKAILAACPDFVPMVLAGDDLRAFQRCVADARLAKWATLAIQHRDDLEQSLFLVQLKMVDLLPTEEF